MVNAVETTVRSRKPNPGDTVRTDKIGASPPMGVPQKIRPVELLPPYEATEKAR